MPRRKTPAQRRQPLPPEGRQRTEPGDERAREQRDQTTRAALAEILPRKYLVALIRRFGGQVIRVPATLHPQLTPPRAKDREIVDAYDELKTYAKAAEAVGVSLSTAKRATKRHT